MMDTVTFERVRFPGSQGELSGELAYGEGWPRAAVLLLNPHPHMGGTMENNLVKYLARELARDSAITLRFDYGGVGESKGSRIDVNQSMQQFWETGTAPWDPFLRLDARAASRWLTEQTQLPVVVIGYSFGAIASAATLPAQPVGIVLISPTVQQHDFSELRRSHAPKWVIYTDDDFATPLDASRSFVGSLDPPVGATRIANGEHFYRGHEAEVAATCLAFVDELFMPAQMAIEKEPA